MKKAVFLLCALLGLALTASQSHAQAATTYSCQRFTDAGGGEVRFEQGTLFADGSGYIPQTSNVYSASTLQLDAATLAQVTGQTVSTLNLYAQLASVYPGYLSSFSRSTATYSIMGVPYVIVSVAGQVPPVTGQGTVTLSAPVPQVAAGSGQVGEFLVTLPAAQLTDLVVNYTVKGSAVNGTDYALLKGTVKVKAGKTSKIIKVVPAASLGGAATKTVKLTLAPGANYGVGITAVTAKVKIVAGN